MELNWRKSSRSSGNGGACVEVAQVPVGACTRDRQKTREAVSGASGVDVLCHTHGSI
jgi:hypothetical protein